MPPTRCHTPKFSNRRPAQFAKQRNGNMREFKRIVQLLKSFIPTAFPVEVRFRQLRNGIAGICSRRGPLYVINICNTLDEGEAIATLLHEFGHALAWNHLDDQIAYMGRGSQSEFDRRTHGPEWGVAYAEVYRTYVADVLPTLEKEEEQRVANRVEGRTT
jgi:hypothetical protein